MGLADLRQYSSSVRIDGRGRFLAVRAELNEETIMSFRNEWMMNMFLSLDRMKQGDNAEKWSVLSDGGRGADAIRDSLDLKEIQDNEEHKKRLRERLNNARERLVESKKNKLVDLFDLMLATGGDPKETVIRLSKKYKLKKRSALRFFERGVIRIRSLLTLEK